MRIACVAVCASSILVGAAAGSAQTFPKPFEDGYFSGLQARAVLATKAGVEIIADPNVLTFRYPLDCCVSRTVMVHNTSTTKVRAE